MAVHCACTVRALCVHCQNTHMCPAEAGNIQHFAAAMNGRRGKQKEIAKLQLLSMNWLCPAKAVKNPKNIST